MNIIELLTEGIGKRILYHYTNYPGLLKILKSGHLKASLYSGGGGRQQIATTRKNTKTDNKNIEMLSGATGGGVKIIIMADKIIGNSKARGASIKPISEYPSSFSGNIADLAGISGEAKVKSYVQKLGKDIDKIEKYTKTIRPKESDDTSLVKSKYYREIAERLKRDPKYSKIADRTLQMMVSNYLMFFHRLQKRENEERITFKNKIKKPNLLLDPKYIKIVLEQKNKFDKELSIQEKLDLIKEIKKNKLLFTLLPDGEKSIVDDILKDRKNIIAEKNKETK